MLGTQMKSTGEVMAIGRSIRKEYQAIRPGDRSEYLEPLTDGQEILAELKSATDQRIFAIAEALRRGTSADNIAEFTGWDAFFINKIKNIVDMEAVLKNSSELSTDTLRRAKRMGFSDDVIAALSQRTAQEVRALRKREGIVPTYKMVDTCAAEFEAQTPYFYSTYERENEAVPSANKKVIIVGAGPIRIGQGIEFDYACVHGVMALQEEGVDAIIVNNNPETVSTDYDVSDRLYFEPLTFEDVLNIIENEDADGVILQFGGQTAINLAMPLHQALEGRKAKVLGTSPVDVDMAEDRELFLRLWMNWCRSPDRGRYSSRRCGELPSRSATRYWCARHTLSVAGPWR